MLGFLLKTPLQADQLDYVRTAEASGKALIWLINDMLDYAQVETGHLKLDTLSFNLRALVDEVLALLTTLVQAKEHPLEVAAIIHQGVPTQVIADPLRLRQVLIHVASNAVKFTQRGHILISIRALPDEGRHPMRLSNLGSDAPPSPLCSLTPTSPNPPTARRFSELFEAHQLPSGPRTLSGLPTADDSLTYESICQVVEEEERRAAGELLFSRQSAAENLVAVRRRVRVEFTVEDTGIGIPPASREVMFQPFAIVNGTQQRTYGGTGMGLALSQRLTALMGGRIQYVSEEGVGSTFRVRCSVEALEGGPEGMGALPAPGGLQGKKVLLVDGSHVRQQVVKSYLRHLGMEVEVSDNLYGALMAIQTSVVGSVGGRGGEGEEPWDVVFVEMDAEGPGTGIQFGQLLLKSDEIKHAVWTGVSIPKLVLLSSLPPEEVEAESHRNFFAMCIGKPLRSIPLAHSLHSLLGVNPGRSNSSSRSMSTGSDRTDSRMLFSLAAILEHKRILVCDHTLVDQKVALETLDRLGAGEVHCVSSGQEVLRLLAPPHDFDCVLMDVEMPGMDG